MIGTPKRKLVAVADLKAAAVLVAGWLLTAALPHSADEAAVAWLRRRWRRTQRQKTENLGRLIERAMPERFDSARALGVAQEWFEQRAELTWGRLRGLHRSEWRVRIDLEGIGHVERALEQGRGAVLWFFSLSDPVLMMRALSSNGVPLSHLSFEAHGCPGKSHFGVATVARLHRRTEDRYLRERVVMRDPRNPRHLKRLHKLLEANQVVTIRGDSPTTSPVPAKCLGIDYPFPGGAPSVAFRSRSPLLTGYVTRLGSAHYRVVIQEALAVEKKDRRDFIRTAVAEYARRLERPLAANPEQWEAWSWNEQLVQGQR